MSDRRSHRIRVGIASQQLVLLADGRTLVSYPVSTAVNGPGERTGSEQTPRGRHVIRAKIGAGLPAGAVLAGRRPTGEIWHPALAARWPERDWILSRILWLSGCEVGRNRLGPVDSMRRYIYIHGTPDTASIGRPASHGCVRMTNADVMDLFDRVGVGTIVDIEEQA
jgi:lipoprotein-anchoring transpeptidase ErfK/SrfK